MKLFQYWILTLTSTLLLFSSCKKDAATSADLYSAVPKSSVLVLESRSIGEALNSISQTSMYSQIDSLPPILAFAEELKSLKGNFDTDSVTDFLKKRPVVMAVALSGAEKYGALFIAPGNKDFEKSIGKRLSSVYKVSQKTYSEAEVYHFYKEDKSKNYYVSSYRNLLLFSTSSFLLEEGIRQVNSEFNIKQNPQFQKLYNTSNKKDLANLYINLKELPEFSKTKLPLGNQQFISRMGSWAELDIQAYNKELLMSGLILFPENEPYFLQSFQKVKARETEGQKIVPAASGLWVSHTFANAEQYYRNYLAYLESAGRLRKHEQLLEKLDFDHNKHLLEWVDSEMGIFTTTGEGGRINYVAYFKHRDEDDAREALNSLATDFIEGYRGIIIKKLKAENALPRFYGPIFTDFHYPYFIVSNGFALFAEDLSSMKGIINDMVDGKTLGADEEFKSFSASLPSESHIKIIASSPGFLNYASTSLEGGDAKILEKNFDKLSNFRWAALQINVDDAAALTNFYMLQSTQRKERVARLWNVELQSDAANTPQFLKNYTNAKYDVAVQDKDYRLYLIDYSGKLLWTKNLDGPIMGNITQIDIYKNNKLQMVLNTRETLYVIDRLGRDVENFPVKLKEPATAPVGVFNYDLARNYRLVVPCGKNLKNYGVDGKEVKGWNFKASKHELITQPQHFTVSKKDVIVVLNDGGQLLQLNRRGEQRFEPVEGLPKLQIPFFLKERESLAKSEMLANGPDGKLYSIMPGGTADNLYLDEENPADYFIYFDEKYVFSHDEKLIIKSDNQPWSAELDGDISTRPKVMIFGNEFYAAAFSKSADEIRLFNKMGELIEGFPVYAQGPFDMGSLKQDGAINIVTYTEDGTLVCYRVN
ncbi:hypothetical protein [Owenweeksia hongkongensis]|uniref:hypothetical protein n=1 Tax=Owenweeksia hongkongensis TaxID=253245 RepID=UPI003A9466D6